MLCAPVFIFTSGSSTLFGLTRCGLSVWLSLLAIFNAIFWASFNAFFLSFFFFLFFSRENVQNTKNSKSAIFIWYENGRRRLLGAQSINTERASWSSGMKGAWPGHWQLQLSINLRVGQTSLFEWALISYLVATAAARFRELEHHVFTNTSTETLN